MSEYAEFESFNSYEAEYDYRGNSRSPYPNDPIDGETVVKKAYKRKETAVIETTFSEVAETRELIVIKQLPMFEQSFIQANAEIQKRLAILKDLDVSEESKNQAKKIRADLNKELTAYEERRKAVKKEISSPYEELEKLYKGYIYDPYNGAILEISKKITDIEKQQLDKKYKESLEYFKEYCDSLGEDLAFLNFCRLEISVNLSVTEKKLKEQIREKCDRIKADIESLKTMGELSDKYIICYRNLLDVSKSISTVNAAVEEEKRFKAEKDKCDKIEAAQKEAVEKVEQFAPPVEVEVVKVATAELQPQRESEKIYLVKFAIKGTTTTFEARGILPDLKNLKRILIEGGCELEPIK